MRILANENIPGAAVNALQENGHDVLWIRTESPGLADSAVLALAQSENRVLITFDKDFGELAYRARLPSTSGIILFRIKASSPENVAQAAIRAIAERTDWEGHFAVVEDDRIRMSPLPAADKD